jgi:hypothetical protein
VSRTLPPANRCHRNIAPPFVRGGEVRRDATFDDFQRFIADVGESTVEEVNVVSVRRARKNAVAS